MKLSQLGFLCVSVLFLVCYVLIWFPRFHPQLPVVHFLCGRQKDPVKTSHPLCFFSVTKVLFLSLPSRLSTTTLTSIPTILLLLILSQTHYISCKPSNLQFQACPQDFTVYSAGKVSTWLTFSLPSSLRFSLRSFWPFCHSCNPGTP